MGCAGRYTHEPLVDVNGEIVKIQNYLDQMKLPWNLLYQDDILAVLHYGSFCFVTPKDYITSTLFKNLDDQCHNIFKSRQGRNSSNNIASNLSKKIYVETILHQILIQKNKRFRINKMNLKICRKKKQQRLNE